MMKKRAIIILVICGMFLLFQSLEATWFFKRLTWNTGFSSAPTIALDSNNHIHVVWEDNTPGNYEIFHKKSTNKGVNWTLKRLTWNSGQSYYPAIAIDTNNHIHIVWFDMTPGNAEIFYKKSTDGGANWSQKRLTWNSSCSECPAIAVDSNNHIHVVWEDWTPGNAEIFYKKSTDGGASWSHKRLTWNSDHSCAPVIAIDTYDHIHVSWFDMTPGNAEIFYKKSTDGGTTWSHERLTWNSGQSGSPAIAVDSNNHIHVAWADYTPGFYNTDIFYKKSTDGGANWILKRLTWNSGQSYRPAIAVDSDTHIHVVWWDNTPGNYEIFYKLSTDGGANWSLERLTWNSGSSCDPSIAIDSDNNIYVVWENSTDEDTEIFYKGPGGGSILNHMLNK